MRKLLDRDQYDLGKISCPFFNPLLAVKWSGNAAWQETGRWLNNRAENSHLPFRRREKAMAKFRSIKSLQKFVSIHSSVHNHLNQDRHLNRRDTFKENCAKTLTEWRQLAA